MKKKNWWCKVTSCACEDRFWRQAAQYLAQPSQMWLKERRQTSPEGEVNPKRSIDLK